MFSIFIRNNRKPKNKEDAQVIGYNDIFNTFAPPGHFYSPFPNISEIENYNNIKKKTLQGINLNDKVQKEFLQNIQMFYNELPWEDSKIDNLRYYYKNNAFEYSDAIFLYGMIRSIKPQQIIEVGCGFSSCVMLDTNELFLNNNANITFIEPYPQLLKSLMKEKDLKNNTIIEKNLQYIPMKNFKELNEGDFLFIDSTHVSKFNSDVNYILHEILPSLKKGVFIHFHDIFYPFEYPKEWLYEGRAWNHTGLP